MSVSKNKLISVRQNKRDDFVAYTNRPYKQDVADKLMMKFTNVDSARVLEDYEIDTFLWNTDALSEYREARIRDRLESYLAGNSSALPQNVIEKFESSNLSDARNRVIYVYPDMDLPDYIDTKRVGVGTPKPTFSRLGLRSPIFNQEDTPRTDSDVVEPDFCFNYEPLGVKVARVNDRFQLTLPNAVREAWRFLSQDFMKIITDDIPTYVRYTAQHLFENVLTNFPIDDLLDDDASKELDDILNKEQSAAAKKRNEIQNGSLASSTSEENSGYVDAANIDNESTINIEGKGYVKNSRGENLVIIPEEWTTVMNSGYDVILDPPGYTMYDRFMPTKAFSDEAGVTEIDSGKNVYGGIIPDSSFNQELRDGEGNTTD